MRAVGGTKGGFFGENIFAKVGAGRAVHTAVSRLVEINNFFKNFFKTVS